MPVERPERKREIIILSEAEKRRMEPIRISGEGLSKRAVAHALSISDAQVRHILNSINWEKHVVLFILEGFSHGSWRLGMCSAMRWSVWPLRRARVSPLSIVENLFMLPQQCWCSRPEN